MRILFVLEHFHPYTGGAEELFKNLTIQLAKAGHEVTVATTLFDRKLPKLDDLEGVTIHRIVTGDRYLFTFLSLPKILKLAKNADIIHTTSYNAALPARIAAWIRGKKSVITFHEVWGQLWFKLPFAGNMSKRAYYWFEQFILKLNFDKFIAVSEFTKDKLMEHGIAEHKIAMIYNGLTYHEFDKYTYKPPETFTYCFFGRLGISKGIDILLKATKLLTHEYPDARLKFIIPTYPEALYNQVMSLIDEIGIRNKLIFLHNLPREQLFKEITSSSCAIISSHSEGFCFAAAETVALQVPVVSSDKGALKETVSGKYIKMKDLTVEGTFEALKKAYHGEWTDTDIRYFHLKDSVDEYLRFYESITND